ncbi:cupin domain-containing protein [Variovorax sp. PCZ-1]|uniref:JmjC domain-containing protein n=1 Tax=Variovorax sp. PCZ-1 TaxID=2835533 RepID=UPI001BCF3A1C|nr:cupin domain-containing protein [Variovorax sp. PCZ-1]MBS7807269.1 cupin domain-containing protein [Variovorax sp. PCZ-1]
MNVKLPLVLLGGISPEQFMSQYWQKKPLLIRAAVPDFKPLVSVEELLDFAAHDEVESRLVEHTAKGWKLTPGPVQKAPGGKKKDWTLLVQGMDVHSAAVHALLQQFRFVPDARLDDVMISLAGEGGGVGPHFDSYDVFLLQASGRRRWQISAQKDLALVDGAPLKILQNFKPTQEWVLEPGDMLYLPPRYAHDGVALDALCQTYSIGFRAPKAGELARELLHRLAEEIADSTEDDPKLAKLYEDKAQEATSHPGQMPAALMAFALDAVSKSLADKTLIEQLIGEYLTDPKAGVYFDEGSLPKNYSKVVLHAATRMSYDTKHMFINGQSFKCAGTDAKLLRKLADERQISAIELRAGSPALLPAIGEFAKEGWLRGE